MRSLPSSAGSRVPPVSVVIPAFNEASRIGRCLESLASQAGGVPFEVIVVDNASTDGTAGVARSYAGHMPLRVIRESVKGRGLARATGGRAARGGVLCCTDADTILPPDWIARIDAAFRAHPEWVAVTGSAMLKECPPSTATVFAMFHPFFKRMQRIGFRQYTLTGYNCAIRKDAYDRAGGFDGTLNGPEDMEISFRLKKYGTIGFLPDLKVMTSGRRFTGKRSLVTGVLEYSFVFVCAYILRSKNVQLSDIMH